MTRKKITAFGRYWEFGEIEESSNQLLGRRKGSDTPVNMAHQAGVYILYEREKAVYVGKTESGGLIERLKVHCKGKKWGRWDRFSWFGLRSVNEETGKLLEIEREQMLGLIPDVGESLLIEVLEPYLNQQSGNSIGEMYVQVRRYVKTVQGSGAGRRTSHRR